MTGNSTTHAPSIKPRRTPPLLGRARAGFREALVAEGIKIRTVRSTVWTSVVMMALILATAVFVGASESLQPDDTILGGSLTGAVTAQIAAAIFGVLAISGEYSTGTIRTTFTACPRRHTVLAAKAVVVAGVTFVVGFLACFLAYQIGTLMLSGKGYASGEPMPALVGVALSFSATGVLGVAVGTILRHSAGAITAVIGISLMPSLFGPLLGDLQRWVAGAAPAAAVQKLAQSSDAVPDVAGSLGAWPSLLIVCAYCVAALMTGAWRLTSRDA